IAMRGVILPLRGSGTGTPVEVSAASDASTSPRPRRWLRTANAPDTNGVACDVPLMRAKPSGGNDDTIDTPGASSDSDDEEFEKPATRSSPVTAPTLTAELMHAGEDR